MGLIWPYITLYYPYVGQWFPLLPRLSTAPKATLQILEHTMQVLAGASLKNFQVPVEYEKALSKTKIKDLKKLKLEPISHRYTLRIVPCFMKKIWFSFQSWNNCHWSFVAWHVIICIRIIYERCKVADEEARQWRGFNLMFSTLNMRGLPQQELCHPLWNDFRRSVAKARLNGSLMKAMGLLPKVRFFSRVLDLCLITG